METLLFADENGEPLPGSDDDRFVQCHECLKWYTMVRLGEDDWCYCEWCYDSIGQDPGAWHGIDPEN